MTAAIELDDFLAHLHRPGATPAPKPVTQPTPTGDNPLPSRIGPTVTDPGLHRWAPNANRQRLTELLDDIERFLDGPEAA